MSGRYDVIVVGAGSTGCVVATRLTEDPALTVLLVEAGPDPRPIPDIIANPARQADLLLESPFVRMYDVERPVDGSTFPLLAGRVVGGGSSVNNMSVVRPIRRDFEAWSRFGGAAWSYDALLPVMRAIETDPDFAGDPIHGGAGPLHLERSFKLDMPASPPTRALIEAAVDLGLPRCDDLNVPEPLGVCASPYNVRNGRRQSTAVAYLDQARERPNLTICPETLATRLVVSGDRVTGVELRTARGLETVEAGRVVISSGVFHSPQLLMLSGIGPADAVERIGVRSVLPLDGVGENYQDHAVVYMTFEGTGELREQHVIPKVRLIAPSDPSLGYGDLHVFMRPAIHMPGLTPLLPVSIHLLDHRSRGRVSLASDDPAASPQIQPALLEHPDDITAMTNAMRFITTLTEHPALAEFYGPLVQPDGSTDWTDYALQTFTSYYHGVGTCRLGPSNDPGAVVDPRLRVHGMENLWVMDASVLPTVPRANTNLSAIMVGEVGAATLREAM